MKVYTASGWIAASSASVATLATFEFVATAGQTVFSGNDANSNSLSYVAPALIVTLNGVRLRPGDDYTATNGTSITLVSAAALNDELVVDAFGSFLVANTYTIAQTDAGFVAVTGNQTIAGTKTFSNPITASAGTVSAPGITTTGDSNTGIFFPAADTIAFAEGGTEVMRIDSSGRVTTPFQPCFHVRLNTGTYLTTSPLPFTNAVFDVGSNFNTSTYRFTAPVAGKYGFLFNGYFRFNANNENGAFGFRVNASNRQYAEFTIVTATVYASPCMTAIFDLGVGDYVDVRFSGNSDYYGGNEETNFYGWLIG